MGGWCVCGVCGVCGVWCVVWCGVVWCGVVWWGGVWCGVVWCCVVWCGVVWCGVVWVWVWVWVWCGVVCVCGVWCACMCLCVGVFGGHRLLDQTMRILKRLVWWSGMRREVAAWIDGCMTCIRFRKRPTKQDAVAVKTRDSNCWEEVMVEIGAVTVDHTD